MIYTYTLNHFGIVSATCKELNVEDVVDSLIPPDPQQKVTAGQAMVAMIINGLGFSNRRLYLFPQFFEKKPVKLLIGGSLTPEDINDDAMGRALDRIFDYGCTELFCSIASKAAEAFNVDSKFGHLDTTTFSVHGDYKSSELEGVPIQITHGHSKQKRPDLKQIVLNLLVTSDGGIPIFMQALNGNSSDVTTFRKTVTEFRKGLKKNLQEITYWVADSCFYNKATLDAVDKDVRWISRVPEKMVEAKQTVRDAALTLDKLKNLGQEGYTYCRHHSSYAGVKQRWLVIHSEQAQKRGAFTTKRAINKEAEKIKKSIKQINGQAFKCEEDAWNALAKSKLKSRFHKVIVKSVTSKQKYLSRGRPSKAQENKVATLYFAACSFEKDESAIDLEIKKRSIFIVATNEISEEKLTDQEIFENYKGQHKVERGFRFLKDPLFFASSLFLKKPSRIVALTMLMCVSLLVYSLAERKLRNLLKEHGKTIKNQVGKPTARPTLRWIFQLFEDIHAIKIVENSEERWEVKNVRPEGEKALRLLGHEYMKPYLLEQINS